MSAAAATPKDFPTKIVAQGTEVSFLLQEPLQCHTRWLPLSLLPTN